MSCLKEIIEFLENCSSDTVVPYGFGKPMSYRGDYYDIAFKPENDISLGEMLFYAREALGKTFVGYKGGNYTMNEYTTCWIAEYDQGGGDCIGSTLMKYWKYFDEKK